MAKQISDYEPKNMRYRNICKHGSHIGTNGHNIAVKFNGGWCCMHCLCKMPNGLYEYASDDIPEPDYKKITFYKNDEERKAAHIQRVMQWNKDNPQKRKQYLDKYEPTRNIRAKERYDAMSPEQKAEYQIKTRENYLKRRESILAKRKADYQAKKDADGKPLEE